MTLIEPDDLEGLLAPVVGQPVIIDLLKYKPGRRMTVQATGPLGTVIAKAYTSQRAPTVAARVAALAAGPAEPILPRVLSVDADSHVVILTVVEGKPLGDAIDSGSPAACYRAGAALGRWHGAWDGRPPAALRPHAVARELEILDQRAAKAHPPIALAVRYLAPQLATPWPCSTAVHRDLYEDQIIVGEHVGLIDLDDASIGPPELDLGNLLAHLELRRRHSHRRLDSSIDQIFAGYHATGPTLNSTRLLQCRQLARLRLACIHTAPDLIGC
jgi:Ser/Thr protein kinase RdoA (MazF antagonist)